LSIRHLMSQLGDAVVVKGHVSRELELTKTLFKDRTRPVLFENLDGYPAVGNLWPGR